MAGRKKTRGRRNVARRPPRDPEPLTAAQAARYTFMKTATPPTDQKKIADALRLRGVTISRQSVGHVIRNRFVNDDVIEEFCKQTGKTRADAWPDVPEHDADTPTPATGTDG
jgi:hypothetical protein